MKLEHTGCISSVFSFEIDGDNKWTVLARHVKLDMKICYKLQIMYDMLFMINRYKHSDDVNPFDVMFNKFNIEQSVLKLQTVAKQNNFNSNYRWEKNSVLS
jgi:hypothetical protein